MVLCSCGAKPRRGRVAVQSSTPPASLLMFLAALNRLADLLLKGRFIDQILPAELDVLDLIALTHRYHCLIGYPECRRYLTAAQE